MSITFAVHNPRGIKCFISVEYFSSTYDSVKNDIPKVNNISVLLTGLSYIHIKNLNFSNTDVIFIKQMENTIQRPEGAP